ESYKHIFEEKNNEQHKNIQQIKEESSKQEYLYQQNQISFKMGNSKKNIKKDTSTQASPFINDQDTVEQLKYYDSKMTYDTDIQNI
ncbi:hypothetical protein ABPG72_001116, partial [Tetrahymena utriculariae]